MYVVVIGGVILIVCYLLYRLVKKMSIFGESIERISSLAEPSCQHRICGQYCTMVVTHERTDLSRPSTSDTISTSIYPVSSNFSYNETNSSRDPLDLPPSYISTISNSSHQLNCFNFLNENQNSKPPPYSEVVNNFSVNQVQNR